MGEQVGNRDWTVLRFRDHEPRQVAFDRRVELDALFVDELEDGDRGKGLSDRADLEERLGGDRLFCREIGEPIRADRERRVRVRDPERQPRLPAALHLGLDRSVDPCDDRFAQHVCIVRRRPLSTSRG